MKDKIVSTTYAPLRPPYQVVKYGQDVAIQIGTLIVTVQKDAKSHNPDYKIETHSHPVVAYENKYREEMANAQLTRHELLEGAVWNNVEVRELTTICLVGATLTWKDFITVLEHESMLNLNRCIPEVNLYWNLKKLGINVLPPEKRECTVQLNLMLQQEELGLSLQSYQVPLLYLNVSVAEAEIDKTHVIYDEETGVWSSDVWKEEQEIFHELSAQLSAYRYVLRDLLLDEDVKYFTVTYVTDDERLQKIVEQMNHTEDFVNLAYNS